MASSPCLENLRIRCRGHRPRMSQVGLTTPNPPGPQGLGETAGSGDPLSWSRWRAPEGTVEFMSQSSWRPLAVIGRIAGRLALRPVQNRPNAKPAQGHDQTRMRQCGILRIQGGLFRGRNDRLASACNHPNWPWPIPVGSAMTAEGTGSVGVHPGRRPRKHRGWDRPVHRLSAGTGGASHQ